MFNVEITSLRAVKQGLDLVLNNKTMHGLNIFGRLGTGKVYWTRALLQDKDSHWLAGRFDTFDIYKEMSEHPDSIIVADMYDFDYSVDNRNQLQHLVRAATNTQEVNPVIFESMRNTGPRKIDFRGKLILITDKPYEL